MPKNEGLKSYHIGNKRDTISACRSWVKPFPLISALIFGCLLLYFFAIFFIEMVNLLSGVFCYQYTAEYLGNPTISILFLQQGFALFAGFR
uniref:Uncharacterized protein n=1 Tax=Kuenenia stuttgartiensis TaxID=174633 RepID=Q1Q5Q1_KUEST|nr:hypothetical protein kuste4580 [Candidatus Kuenenia stuttgartiensis]